MEKAKGLRGELEVGVFVGEASSCSAEECGTGWCNDMRVSGQEGWTKRVAVVMADAEGGSNVHSKYDLKAQINFVVKVN